MSQLRQLVSLSVGSRHASALHPRSDVLDHADRGSAYVCRHIACRVCNKHSARHRESQSETLQLTRILQNLQEIDEFWMYDELKTRVTDAQPLRSKFVNGHSNGVKDKDSDKMIASRGGMVGPLLFCA